MLAQTKPFKGPTRELLGGTEENSVSPMRGRDGLFDLSLFTETWSFCLFFSPIVNSSREEAADGSSTHCRAEGAAVHSSVKRKRKKIGDFFIWNHFLNTVSLFDSWRSRG